VWAVLHGAQIITTAWGVGMPVDVVRAAIRFARDWPPFGGPQRGVLVVAAAGNDGLDNDVIPMPTYPASYVDGAPDFCPNLISVMASDRDDDKAWFSNYGAARVDIAAPGVDVLSTDTYLGGARWRPLSGTSAACALVTYAAALVKTLNPTWSPTEIRDHLVRSAEPSPWLRCVAQGRLNLDRVIRGPFMITSPLEGGHWNRNQPNPITWTNRYVTGRPTTRVRIELSQNGGPYTALGPSQPNEGALTVMAPNANVPDRSDEAPALYAESGVFKIV
jgi:hypothetical protein